jgi:hypothetical protein
LIGKALALNHISSSDAEKYYLRLATIESNLQNTNTGDVGSSDQLAATNRDLRVLKSELLRKIDGGKMTSLPPSERL